MREIKFRVWIKKTKYENGFMLYENDKETDYCMLSNGNGFGIHDGSEWLDDDGFEIMQFTGLKDKNGKEIYEGDILDLGIARRHVVIFQEGCFGAKDHAGFSPFRDSLWGLGGKVVGNIYENIDLLKD